MEQRIKNIHVGLLLLLISNYLLKARFGFGFDERILFIFKAFAYTSGIWLFIFLVKAKKNNILKYYACLYIVSPIAVLVGWMIDGIMGAILGSIFLALWGPPASVLEPNSIIKDRNYELRPKFSGFLGGCCAYTLNEKKWLVFDLQVTELRDTHPSADISEMKVYTDKVVLYFKKAPLDSTTIQI